MYSIPFKLPDLHQGFVEVKGLLSLEDEFLVIDVQTSLLDMFEQDAETIKIEIAALRDAYIDRGLFRDRICIIPKGRALLDALPGVHAGEVRFIVWKKYRRTAERLVEALVSQIA